MHGENALLNPCKMSRYKTLIRKVFPFVREKKVILTLVKTKEGFIQNYCDQRQNFCNRRERWDSTLNITKAASDLQPRGRVKGKGMEHF